MPRGDHSNMPYIFLVLVEFHSVSFDALRQTQRRIVPSRMNRERNSKVKTDDDTLNWGEEFYLTSLPQKIGCQILSAKLTRRVFGNRKLHVVLHEYSPNRNR